MGRKIGDISKASTDVWGKHLMKRDKKVCNAKIRQESKKETKEKVEEAKDNENL